MVADRMVSLVLLVTVGSIGIVSGQSTTVECRTEYITLWDTIYKETETQQCTTVYDKTCKTEYEKVCKTTYTQVCNTVYESQCKTLYKNVCEEHYRTEYEPYTETECTTLYKEDCEYRWEGEGNEKVWAPITGTCNNNPYDECKDVTKTKAVQVSYPVCEDVPEEKCVNIPRQECVSVPQQSCTNKPYQTCSKVPKQECVTLHKKVPVRISKEVPKKICDYKETKQAEEVTENTRNVSLASILGLININERKGVIDAEVVKDTSNENNKTGLVTDHDTRDRFIFL